MYYLFLIIFVYVYRYRYDFIEFWTIFQLVYSYMFSSNVPVYFHSVFRLVALDIPAMCFVLVLNYLTFFGPKKTIYSNAITVSNIFRHRPILVLLLRDIIINQILRNFTQQNQEKIISFPFNLFVSLPIIFTPLTWFSDWICQKMIITKYIKLHFKSESK